jgi:uncharacterized protein (DUF885 family)
MKNMKKLLNFIVAVIFLFTISACNFNIHKGETFDELTDDFFYAIIGNDEMAVNTLFNNPADFGLGHFEPFLPEPYVPSEEESGSAIGDFLGLTPQGFLDRLHAFDYNALNEDEQNTYLIIEDVLQSSMKMQNYMYYLDNSYLGSYLGYQAQLPLVFAEYNFRDQTDVDNYLKLLQMVPATFDKYYNFEVLKADKGYGMPDFVIDKVIGQCETFLTDIDNNFLIPVFNERIDAVTFLNDTQRADYKAQNENAVKNSLKSGYENLKNNLPALKGRATNNEGLSHYEGGKEYYQYLFQQVTGYDMTIDAAKEYLETQINKRLTQFINLLSSHPGLAQEADSVVLFNVTPLEQLNFYKGEIVTDFPSISEYNINASVKYIHPSMEGNFSPAAYIVSPIDEMVNEYIYLNGKDVNGNPNYLYSTLAHEGFPGHLFQNVYFKNQDVNIVRKVLRNSGYTEGWATYAEMYSYRFSDADSFVLKTIQLNDEINGAITALLDMVIHYDGYSKAEVNTYLSQQTVDLSLPEETLTSVYEQLVEVPTNPQEYFFTYFKLADMYQKAKATLGLKFNEKEFHTLILNMGPMPMRFVEEKVNKYIAEKQVN